RAPVVSRRCPWSPRGSPRSSRSARRRWRARRHRLARRRAERARQGRVSRPAAVAERRRRGARRLPAPRPARGREPPLFLRHFAPFVGLAGTGALRGVLARACVRAGVPYASPHRLRHTTATELLRAGAPLSEIGELLRHRSVVTTAVYAKVDHEQLR